MIDPAYITREEFGVNLFDTIKAIVKLDSIQAQVNYAVFHNEATKLAGSKKEYSVVHQEIAKLLPKLTEDEMAQILARYPFVVNL